MTQKYGKYLWCIILCLLTSEVFAESGLFTPTPTDQSVIYLGSIFGRDIGSITLGNNTSPLLGSMFEKFNSIILGIAIFILSYIVIVSTINTAQDGQIMGKKWSSVWLPIRALMGMLFLVPGKTGYSMIQVLVMWIVLQGIGAADQVWTFVLKQVSTGVSISATAQSSIQNKPSKSAPNSAAIQNNSEDTIKNLLYSAVCLESLRTLASGEANKIYIEGKKPVDEATNKIKPSDITTKYANSIRSYTDTEQPSTNDSMISYSQNFNIGIKDNTEGLQKICGSYSVKASVTFSGSNNELKDLHLNDSAAKSKAISLARSILEKKQEVMASIFEDLRSIAKKIVSNEVKPRKVNGRSKNGVGLDDSSNYTPTGIISQEEQYYINAYNEMKEPINGDENNTFKIAEQTGWLFAGVFYFDLIKSSQNKLLSTTSDPVQCDVPNYVPDNNKSLSDAIKDQKISALLDNLNLLYSDDESKFIASRMADAFIYAAKETNSSENAPVSNLSYNINSKGKEFTEKILNKFISLEHPKGYIGEPLVDIAKFGSDLMIESEIIFLGTVAAFIATGIFSMTCFGKLSAGPVLATLVNILIPIVFLVLTLVWSFGANLAVYVPMIPYMIYTSTAIGWFILVIEAIVAAPLLSLGLIIPSQDELGKIVPGLYLLLGIALRPILMVFGFIIASRLLNISLSFINSTMVAAILRINIKDSILYFLAALLLYVGFTTSIVNKCFSLIYILPDKILRWIGGTQEQSDVGGELKEAKSQMEPAKNWVGFGVGLTEGLSSAATKNKPGGDSSSGDSKGNSPGGDPGSTPGGGGGADAEKLLEVGAV